MHVIHCSLNISRTPRWSQTAARLLVFLCCWLAARHARCGDAPVTESQVKALFLVKFAKYVDWPDSAFSSSNAPIIIGVIGKDRFGDNLSRAIEGRTVNGHAFLIKHLATDTELTGCQILFISDSEAPHMAEILDKVKSLPVLTVGEDKQFAQTDGIIDFTLKDKNVRLDINLAAANRSGLKISSKLLSVADVVKGR